MTRVKALKIKALVLACTIGLSLNLPSAMAQENTPEQNPLESKAPIATAKSNDSPTNLETTPEVQANVPDENGYYVGGPVYVSDSNKVWTRSGPGEGYRVTGAREIGEKLTFKRYSDNGRYAQLEKDGETFWMPLTTIQPNINGKALVSQLEEKISSLQYRLDNYDTELAHNLKKTEQQLSQLKKENAELKGTLSTKEATIQELDALYRDAASRLETKDLDMQMRWWMQGAIIALCGAIAGVVFVFIPRPARKSKRDRY